MSDLLVGQILEAASQTDAGVVDQSEDASGLGDDVLDSSVDAGLIGNVQLNHFERHAALLRGLQHLSPAARVADRGVHRETLRREVQGRLQPQPHRAARH